MKTKSSLVGMAAALVLAGCVSNRIAATNVAAVEPLAPVYSSNVSTSSLPPLGPNGEVQTLTPLAPALSAPTTASAGSSIELVPSIGTLPNSSGRDLGGGLTVQKLLGRWTVVSGGTQCQLNLTQTAKSGTGRYRASAPACTLAGFSTVASWTLAGTQIQLFDDSGKRIGTLIQSGNRFVGTLAGGIGISMVG